MLDDLIDGDDDHEQEGGVIGIDLGTTNSVVAYVSNGRVEIVTNDDGHRLHPSVVAFKPNGEQVVGMAARMRRVIDPQNTIFSAKRIIGQPFRSRGVREAISHFPYAVEEGPNQEPIIRTRAGHHPVPEISGMVLSYLRSLAEDRTGQSITHCVVTVPANFSDGQREATRRAAENAGMEVLRILNEPTAAALAYGTTRSLHQRIAIFDLGGGTFDMTLLAVRDDLYEVLATGGDPFLGGDDMDRSVCEYLAERYLQQHRIDIRDDPNGKARLLIAAEQIKMRLTTEDAVEGTLNELGYGEGGAPLALTFRITREKFDSLIEPIVTRAISKAAEVLEQAGIQAEHLDEIILVGGATQVPLVQKRVAEQFGRTPRADISPMEVVAAGAALHGHSLFAPPGSDQASVGLLMDVTSHSLGLATAGGFVEVLIEKNTSIPAEKSRIFTTAHDYQDSVTLRVCQGESKREDENIPVGELVLSGLRPAARGDTKVEVSFLIDADGMLQVSARDSETGKHEMATLRVLGVGDKSGTT